MFFELLTTDTDVLFKRFAKALLYGGRKCIFKVSVSEGMYGVRLRLSLWACVCVCVPVYVCVCVGVFAFVITGSSA